MNWVHYMAEWHACVIRNHGVSFESSTIPQFPKLYVKNKLLGIRTGKSVPPGNILTKVIMLFAGQIAIPLKNIKNLSISSGIWPDL